MHIIGSKLIRVHSLFNELSSLYITQKCWGKNLYYSLRCVVLKLINYQKNMVFLSYVNLMFIGPCIIVIVDE